MLSEEIREARAVAAAIVAETESITASLSAAKDPFARRDPQKWSPAEHVEHLRLSVRPLNLSFLIPTFALRVFGTARGSARTYNEVVTDYRERLARGAKASGPFIPRSLTRGADLDRLIAGFRAAQTGYAGRLAAAEGPSLDSTLLPHPILGRLSMREMAFFTLYHLGHHHALIKREAQAP
jgi:DinB superfamily